MPKRIQDEDSDEYIRCKMRKIEKKLRKRKSRVRVISSDSSDPRADTVSPVPSQSEDGHDPPAADDASQNEQFNHPAPDREVVIASEVSNSALPDTEECLLDNDILALLGASPTNENKKGDNVHKDVALRWEHIATSGLTKEARKDLQDKHLVPGNCPKIAAPFLNPEIKAALSDTMIGKDKASLNKQNQITSVISCIGEALTKILHSEHKDTAIIKPLLEGAQLLCDLQYSESMKRRSLICSSIKKEIKNQLYETEIDTFLFGEKLADTLKAAKAINKSGTEIKATKPKSAVSRVQSRNLNSRPQLAYSRQPAQRGQRPAAYQHQAPAAMIQTQQRYYQSPVQAQSPLSLPPPPPLPLPPPPPPPPQQQRPKRPYQRR